jgi:hypothetical protein
MRGDVGVLMARVEPAAPKSDSGLVATANAAPLAKAGAH